MTRITVEKNTPCSLQLKLRDASDQEFIEMLLVELLPLFEDYADAIVMVDNYDESNCINRAKAVLAVKLLTDSALQNAAMLAGGMKNVASGSENASDYGFPEFDDGVAEGVIE